MWKEKTVSVLLPTYNERDSIRGVVEDFFATGFVDEVVVIDNNAVAGTEEEVLRTRAHLVKELRQGLGWSIRRGLEEATGELLVISEPDGTFLARDIEKLLVFSDDFKVVFGTRTTRTLIWEGANMGLFLKWGNWFVGKLVEVLYMTPHLSDVGCTMRLLHRGVLRRISPHFRGGANTFNLQMMLLIALGRFRFVEVPLNYKMREGGDGYTARKARAFRLGLQMIFYLLWIRLLSWMRLYP